MRTAYSQLGANLTRMLNSNDKRRAKRFANSLAKITQKRMKRQNNGECLPLSDVRKCHRAVLKPAFKTPK